MMSDLLPFAVFLVSLCGFAVSATLALTGNAFAALESAILSLAVAWLCLCWFQGADNV